MSLRKRKVNNDTFNSECVKLGNLFKDIEFCETFVDETTETFSCMLDGILPEKLMLLKALPKGFRIEEQDKHVNLIYEPKILENSRIKILWVVLFLTLCMLLGFISFYLQKYMQFVGF